MKKYVLFISLLLLTIQGNIAAIKNGFSREVVTAEKSLTSLSLLLEQDVHLSVFQRMSIQRKIRNLEAFIRHFELTERLLNQFRVISPELYFEIDTITDRQGRVVDVYVKFLSEANMPRGIVGITNIAQASNDEDAYESEYGLNTVSVRIAISHKSLFLLAHEFGHIRYQVPNLASYMRFYSRHYLKYGFTPKDVGHNDQDPSGRSALRYRNRFQTDFLTAKLKRKEKTPPIFAVSQFISGLLKRHDPPKHERP